MNAPHFPPHTDDVICQFHCRISCRLREPSCTLPCLEFQGKAVILNCGRNTFWLHYCIFASLAPNNRMAIIGVPLVDPLLLRSLWWRESDATWPLWTCSALRTSRAYPPETVYPPFRSNTTPHDRTCYRIAESQNIAFARAKCHLKNKFQHVNWRWAKAKWVLLFKAMLDEAILCNNLI